VSREASVIMDSAPPTDGTGTLTSLWQNNLVGLRAERMVNWKRGVAKSVYYLTDAVYPAVVSPTAMGASLAPASAPATAARAAGARDAAVRA
jgi:hypothetical protein